MRITIGKRHERDEISVKSASEEEEVPVKRKYNPLQKLTPLEY